MKLLLLVRLVIPALDTAIALRAQRTVQDVVVTTAIWVVAMHVKVRSLEWILARLAHKALFMVAARQSAISRTDRLSCNRFTAATAGPFG